MYYGSQRMPFNSLDEYMHVIRHYAPGKKPVALAIKMQQCILNLQGNGLVAEPALAMPRVFVTRDALVQFRFPSVSVVAAMAGGGA